MTAREDRLESWKEIAAYLERTTRTCQKWEADYGLPIYRLDESPRARVYAFRSELDGWLERVLRETEAREAGSAGAVAPPAAEVTEPAPPAPGVRRSAVANKACWAGRNAIERFLTIREPADLATAIGMFKKVRDEDPQDPLAYLGLGDAYRWDYSLQGMRPDRLELMTENYSRAYELAPDIAEAHIGLGWSRYFSGDIAGAAVAFGRAEKIRPADPEVHLEIGNFLIGLGHPDRAARRFTQILAGSASRPRALWLKAGFARLVAHPYSYLYLANPNNHFYDPLRRDPRFQEIVAGQKRRSEEESAQLGDL